MYSSFNGEYQDLTKYFPFLSRFFDKPKNEFPDLSHFLSICDFSILVSGPNVKNENMKVRKWYIDAGSDNSDRYLAWLWWRVSDNHKGVRDGTKEVQELLILPLQCLRLNFIKYVMNNIYKQILMSRIEGEHQW